jgi:hypothetical protein
LLAGITEGNGHDAVDFGVPVGREELSILELISSHVCTN